MKKIVGVDFATTNGDRSVLVEVEVENGKIVIVKDWILSTVPCEIHRYEAHSESHDWCVNCGESRKKVDK